MLANYTQQRLVSPDYVARVKRGTIAVAEVKLRHVAVQVLLAAVLVDALHAALEDGEEAFDGVGSHVAAHLLILAVLDTLVIGEATTQRTPRFRTRLLPCDSRQSR